MKTKNKTIVVLEIAIVLCSMFLMAIPAIAADQTTQEVSTSVITTASEDDYVLDIYGNANEDDTIDMGDVVYTKLAIFGKKPKTELCDAKYDGRINVLDVIQTKLIILGKEKELTVVDVLGEAVTVRKPVKRIVIGYKDAPEKLRILDATDLIVGISDSVKNDPIYFPELSKLPSYGQYHKPDYEAILNLNPDVAIVYGGGAQGAHWKKLPGIAVIYLPAGTLGTVSEIVKRISYLIDKKEEAEEYIDWHEGYRDDIKSQTEELSDDEKPRVAIITFYEGSIMVYGEGSIHDPIVTMAGGRNVAANIKSGYMDPEWLIVQNPDIILLAIWAWPVYGGYNIDDPSEMAAEREKFMNRPEFANLKAVKDGNVYVYSYSIVYGGSRGLVSLAYWAKWFQPELSQDLDPQAIHQEYLTRFQGFDFDVSKHGVFVYHPELHPDGR